MSDVNEQLAGELRERILKAMKTCKNCNGTFIVRSSPSSARGISCPQCVTVQNLIGMLPCHFEGKPEKGLCKRCGGMHTYSFTIPLLKEILEKLGLWEDGFVFRAYQTLQDLNPNSEEFVVAFSKIIITLTSDALFPEAVLAFLKEVDSE